MVRRQSFYQLNQPMDGRPSGWRSCCRSGAENSSNGRGTKRFPVNGTVKMDGVISQPESIEVSSGASSVSSESVTVVTRCTWRTTIGEIVPFRLFRRARFYSGRR